MDDILIIILTIVIGVIGALGQRKKKRAAQSGTPQNSKPTDNLFDLLMDNDTTDAKEISTEPIIPIIEEEKVPEPESEPKPSYKFSTATEGMPSVQKKKMIVKKPKKLNRVTKENFSLRKAVIYNEILNRKYT